MAEYTFGAFETNRVQISNFNELLSIIKGRSIISAADWGNDRFEMGLSGDIMVRFFHTETGMVVNLLNAFNSNENPALVIDMGDMNKRVPINIIETKLKGLRTLYAIFYLIENSREKELQSYILKHPYGDIEKALLKDDEQLYIESISYGSWVMAVWGKTQKAYKSISSVAGLVFHRGREAYLGKLEADKRLKDAEADYKEKEVREKDFDVTKKQLDFLLEISDKLDIPEAKDIIKKKVIEATKNFTMGDNSDNQSYREFNGFKNNNETLLDPPLYLKVEVPQNKLEEKKSTDNTKKRLNN